MRLSFTFNGIIMSRTNRGKKFCGYNFWSRRGKGRIMGCGPASKWITKKLERARDRRIKYDALQDFENYEGRFPGE